MKAYRDCNGLPRVGLDEPHSSTLNWGNLTKEERAEYMRLQMSPAYGVGWCRRCLSRHIELDKKLRNTKQRGVSKEERLWLRIRVYRQK